MVTLSDRISDEKDCCSDGKIHCDLTKHCWTEDLIVRHNVDYIKGSLVMWTMDYQLITDPMSQWSDELCMTLTWPIKYIVV